VQVSLFAQDYSQTVKGKIIDTDSEIPVSFANIILIGSTPLVGTATDIDGNFKIKNVPIGRQSFKISALGYKDVYLNEIEVGTGHEVVLNIEMTESIAKLAEVVVRANNDPREAINQMATVSANQITIESTSRIAAGINDPGRTAQSFAGVSSADDENNELVVRGNSPRGVLWRMEGIEIPNPNHFSNGEGGSGGGVSALSTQVLANSDFFTGAFPAEYGNALSGVFDLNLRKGNSEKKEYTFQVGVLGVQAAIEGPIKKGYEGSYLFNYRYSSLRLLSKAGIDISGGDIAPGWQDLSYKIYLPTKKFGRFSVWGLGGYSDAGYTSERDTSLWLYRNDAFEETEKHLLGVAGLTHNFLFKNNKTYVKTVLAYSYTNNNVIQDTLDYEYTETIVADDEFEYNTFSVNSFLNHKFNAKNTFKVGFIYQDKSFNLKSDKYNYTTYELDNLIQQKGGTGLFESYIQLKHRLSENIDIIPGLHFTQLALNNNYSIEPRLGIKWAINDRHSLNIGGGLHSKIEPISIYLSDKELPDGSSINPNKNLELTKAAHGVLSYNWNFANNWRLKTELYYQYLFDVPIVANDSTNTLSALNFRSGFTNELLENEGTGRNYGIEFTVDKFFSQNWYLLFTSSLFESKYTMSDGVERNTLFNSKYIFNVVGGKEFKVGHNKLNVIGANIRLMWRGGYRTVPIDEDASILENEEIRNYSVAYETKAPDYFRIDLGVNYKRNKPNWSWEVSLNIQNATNRANVWDEYYSPEIKDIFQATMTGLIPILNYKIEF
jgi:hypothetical protein